jgi:hypothetical protein
MGITYLLIASRAITSGIGVTYFVVRLYASSQAQQNEIRIILKFNS